MNDRDLIANAKRWADYLRPVIENDNAWYGKQWLDGKDAGEIGELLEAVAAIGDRLMPELPDDAYYYEITIEVDGGNENPPKIYVLDGHGETLTDAVADAMNPDRGLRDEP